MDSVASLKPPGSADAPARLAPHRAVWISDLHLGTRGCNAELLLDFLQGMMTERLYLVGDVIDFWALKSRYYWPASHSAIVRSICRHARSGTQVIYIPGNHDERLRTKIGAEWRGVQIVDDAIHTMMDGRRLLVVHGDRFDIIANHAEWIARLGASAYAALLSSNHLLNRFRRRLGLPYWSLSAYLKARVKQVVNLISDYENALLQEAQRRAVNGIICGHIHHAELRWADDILYANAGDWVESCTALIEEQSGILRLHRHGLASANSASDCPHTPLGDTVRVGGHLA